MKAIVIHAAKDLRIDEREPETPGPGEVEIRLATGGICGSDLHYYNHGGFGTVRVKEPMILGHEVSGHIAALGEGVSGLAIGDLVAISPSRPCGHCEYCLKGLPNHCFNMRFYGSAMPFPHIQGAFRERLVAQASQCVKADGLSAGEAAMAEPLAVTLHATRRAGESAVPLVRFRSCQPVVQARRRSSRRIFPGQRWISRAKLVRIARSIFRRTRKGWPNSARTRVHSTYCMSVQAQPLLLWQAFMRSDRAASSYSSEWAAR
jgi:L-idonate 5-dehydrogenase